MKRLVSCLMAALLVLVLSVPAYAYTADDLANKLYSGWSQTSSPSGLGGSWYAIVRQFLNSMSTDLSTVKTNSNVLVSKLELVNTYLSTISTKIQMIDTDTSNISTSLGSSSYGSVTYQMSQIRTLLTTISNASSAWTSSQATSVTNKVGTIDSNLSEAKNSLINSESWLNEIYNKSVTIDSDTSSISADVNSLFNGWILQQAGQYVNKNPRSWFGVVGLKINELNGYLVKDKINVTNFNDSDFGCMTWYKGVYATLYRLQQVLADDDDLQMRQDSEENKNVAKDAFLSYDSDTSVKPSDIGGLSNLGSGLRNNFDTGTVEASNLFDFWGSDNTFSWFTQETKDNMVNVSSSGSGARRARAQNDEPIYYSPYGEHMEEYERLMREGIK